jgi:hypothetical protein
MAVEMTQVAQELAMSEGKLSREALRALIRLWII